MVSKVLVWLLANMFLATVSHSDAQQPAKMFRVGVLSGRGAPTPPASDPNADAFRQGLRELGYIEGKNIQLEYRYASGKGERFPDLVTELLQLKVDVLVSGTIQAIRAAKQATKTIPIVMITTADPVATALIESLSHPGGNITGLTRLIRDLSGKRLELLKETVPRISRVGVLGDATAQTTAAALKDYETAAGALKLQVQFLEVKSPKPDFDAAFQTALKQRVNALVAVSGALFLDHAKRIAELAIKHRLPSIHENNENVEAGGLLFYGANDADNYKRAAVYIDKILKGAKPAELPVEQPMKFEFVINLKTAKQIGVRIPQSVLYRADRVIR